MKRYILFVIFLISLLFLSLSLYVRQEDPGPVTLAEFNKVVGDKNKIVLVYFHANWCMVCAKMRPTMHKADSLYRSQLEILNIDTDRDKEVADELEINALPVFMIYKRGIRQWVYTGLITEKDLFNQLNLYTFSVPETKSKN
jgi:thiol-disulfide isomerase/thioredoxin